MYFNSQGQEEVTYDAIVVGSGISGGVAAKELTEKGLKTLVLERGRDIKHGDYPTANWDPWDAPNRGRVPEEEMEKHYFKQSRTGYTITEYTKDYFVKDDEHPYTEIKPFDWMRGYHVGGRSLLWGRQSYRWSDLDFEANAKEGIGTDWPIRYKDIQPWYDHVEKYVGVSGMAEGLPQLPDSNFIKAMELNCVEEHLRDTLKNAFNDRILTIGRTAHLTEQLEGRGLCQYRNRCIRGCPYGGYFSSNAVTLPMADKTGNYHLRPFSIVHSIIVDESTKKAKGVRVVDAETMETKEYFAKVIFLCASALPSTLILMNTKTADEPNGLGNTSDQLGRNVMDHHLAVGARAAVEGFEDKYYKGRRPNGIYIPRFRNVDNKTKVKDFVRGYGYQGGASRQGWGRYLGNEMAKFGEVFKENKMQPGPWSVGLGGFGEILPYEENRIMLNEEVRDKYDMPTLTMDAEIKDNELKMREDMQAQAAEMLESAGFKNVNTFNGRFAIGLGIHEMGTARMGTSARNSVLNKYNQVHSCNNVYVTDGACMTSAACVNPSLTYMALTARAADHAVSELKKTKFIIVMNRREALKQTSLIIGGALTSSTILAVWQGCKSAPGLGFEPQFFTEDQLRTISTMAEVIIPTTDTPGAIEAGVPEYIDHMIYMFGKEDEKTKFQAALDKFATDIQEKYGKSYDKLSSEEQIAEMTALSEQDDVDDFNLFKRMQGLTTTGYFTSELVGENVLNYDPIPGEQIGCMPLSEVPNERLWSL